MFILMGQPLKIIILIYQLPHKKLRRVPSFFNFSNKGAVMQLLYLFLAYWQLEGV